MTLLLALLLLLSQAPETATVYFYRVEEAPKLDSGKPKVYVDDRHAFSMPESEYVALSLKPGEYVFRMQSKASATPLKVEAGKTYFIRVSEVVAHGYQRNLFVTPEEQARLHMKSLKPLEAKNVKDKSLTIIRP
jgi:hypothetical protein